MQRVVLVEADPALREWCRLHLESRELMVLGFDDVRAALQAVRLDPPDLVIVATDLQGAGAFALVAAIRSSLRTALIPILFLVPSHDAEAHAHALSIEPSGIVTKPVTRDVLLKVVDAQLRSANKVSASRGRNLTAPAPAGDRAAEVAVAAGGAALLLETRHATALVVVIRNFVSLARSMSAKPFDVLLRQFMSAASDATSGQGGWIVRADAAGLVALFEDSPNTDRPHPTRAIESALRVLVAARRAKRVAGGGLGDSSLPDLSVGCGVHSGEVVIARSSGGGQSGLTIAGQTAELAYRLDGRAKGLGWSIAASESAVAAAGPSFQFGRTATLSDTDHGVTLSISEVLGFNPGFARPGELPLMAEVREAVLANTMLAKLAGDVAQFDADKTMIFGVNNRVTGETPPHLPGRTIGRRIGLGRYVGSYTATHLATKREEVVKVLRSNELPPGFMAAYLEQYRKVAGINQRNVVSVYETGETTSGAYVALEYLPGGSLSEAIRNKLPVGHALNCLAEMCLALDAVHGTGICHGALRAEHFLFRPDGVLVLTDFNVTERISDSMGLAHPASDRIRSGRGRVSTPRVSGPEMDFRTVGRIFYAMLTGDVAPLQGQSDNQSTGDPSEGVRLPLALSPLQRCLDGLLGAAPGQPGERAEHVLMELLALKEVFPFDIPRGEAGELRQASKRIGG